MMDQVREASVWERVRAASASAPLPLPTPALPEATEPSEADGEYAEQLMQWAEEESGRCMRYRMLAGCACGRDCQCLIRLACRAGETGRRLAALYYIHQGRKLCPQPEALPCCIQPVQALRQLYLEELEAARRYKGMEDQELRCLGVQKEETACRILQLLSRWL